jgi:hypothetical protein
MAGGGLLQHRSRSVVLVVVAAQKPGPRGSATCATPHAATASHLIMSLPGRSAKMPGLHRPSPPENELLMRQVRRSAEGDTRLQERLSDSQHSVGPAAALDRSGCPAARGRDLQRQAWQWAQANRTADGSLPSPAFRTWVIVSGVVEDRCRVGRGAAAGGVWAGGSLAGSGPSRG